MRFGGSAGNGQFGGYPGGTLIGGTIVGGLVNSVLYVNPAGTIDQDNANFTYVKSTGVLTAPTITATTKYVLPAGTVSQAALVWTGDTTAGVWKRGGGEWGFTNGTVNVLGINTNGVGYLELSSSSIVGWRNAADAGGGVFDTQLGRGGVNQLTLTSDGATTNTADLGSSSVKVRTGYFGTSVVSPTYLTNAPNTQTGTTYTVAATDTYLIFNGAATTTVTLPAAASFTGRRIVMKTVAAFTVVSATSNVVPQAGGAAGTAILAATAGKYAELVSDGTNWITFAAN